MTRHNHGNFFVFYFLPLSDSICMYIYIYILYIYIYMLKDDTIWGLNLQTANMIKQHNADVAS